MTSVSAPSQTTSAVLAPEACRAQDTLSSAILVRLGDYAELAKLRIASMVLVTVTVGYTLACQGVWDFSTLLPTLAGVTLVAAASSALNQLLERQTDALMVRTFNRPLPAGACTRSRFCYSALPAE